MVELTLLTLMEDMVDRERVADMVAAVELLLY